MSQIASLRRSAGAALADGFFTGASRLGLLHPRARPEVHGVEALRDIVYAPGSPPLRLDVWRPRERPAGALLPAVLYVHGGGFRILSKDSHWVMALAFARRGHVVFMIDYRLAPRHPFPAAIEDAAEAYAWVVERGHHYGADVSRLVLAGESAGGNLVTALAVASCFERPEPHARRVFASGVTPRVVLPACGLLQVTDPRRFSRRDPSLSSFTRDRIEEVTDAYVGHLNDHEHPELDLADPLRVIERDEAPARPLPPFFITCGTADPLMHDSERLHAALLRRGVAAEARYYRGEQHAFHAMVFLKGARRHWRDTFEFLGRHVPR